MSIESVKQAVREKYGQAALRVVACSGSSCCGSAPSSCCSSTDPITSDLYDELQKSQLPNTAVLASLGGRIDVLLSAKRVGPTGKAYGLDMTDEMLALALENQRKSGLANVEFLKGEIEQIPLPDGSVDVIISNCVINLWADSDRVLREVFRVLKPGGGFAISDVVIRGDVPAEIRRNIELWVGCVAGALQDSEYWGKLVAAGFEQVDLEPTRTYRAEDARDFLAAEGIDVAAIAPTSDGRFVSAFVRGRKPLG